MAKLLSNSGGSVKVPPKKKRSSAKRKAPSKKLSPKGVTKSTRVRTTRPHISRNTTQSATLLTFEEPDLGSGSGDTQGDRITIPSLIDFYRALFPRVSDGGWDEKTSEFSKLVRRYKNSKPDSKVSARNAIDDFIKKITENNGNVTQTLSDAQLRLYQQFLESGSKYEPLWSCSNTPHQGASAEILAEFYHRLVALDTIPYKPLFAAANTWETDHKSKAFIAILQSTTSMDNLVLSDDQLKCLSDVLHSTAAVDIAPFSLDANGY